MRKKVHKKHKHKLKRNINPAINYTFKFQLKHI